MKKLIYSIFSLGILFGFISCKKNYVCTCTTTITEPDYTYNGVKYYGSTDSQVEQETYEEKKYESADAKCRFNEYEIMYSSPNEDKGQGLTTEEKSCELNEF